MAVLLLAEHDNKSLAPATAKALTAARAFNRDVDILVAGEGCGSVAEAAAKLDGVRKVLLAEAPHLAQRLAEETPPRAAADAELFRAARPGHDHGQERAAAGRRFARRGADLRHRRGEIAQHFRAPGLCRQRARDRRNPRQDGGRHGARYRVCRAGEGGSAPIEAITPPAPSRCRASGARRSASASVPSSPPRASSSPAAAACSPATISRS